jgi:hypothetical protein
MKLEIKERPLSSWMKRVKNSMEILHSMQLAAGLTGVGQVEPVVPQSLISSLSASFCLLLSVPVSVSAGGAGGAAVAAAGSAHAAATGARAGVCLC